MKNIAIHINDSNIIVADNTKIIGNEPGYALLDHDKVITGLDAYRKKSFSSHLIFNTYWENLSLDKDSSLERLGSVSSFAEIAYMQLNNICRKYINSGESVILIPPTSYDSHKLGLLLGIANECKINIVGMVNPALMISRELYKENQLFYLDIGLNHFSISSVIDSYLKRDVLESKSIQALGTDDLEKAWCNRIAEIFILKTRFDPLHSANSEFDLQKALPNWLKLLDEDDYLELELPHGGQKLSIEIHRDQLLNAASNFYSSITDLLNSFFMKSSKKKQIFISSSLSSVPGLYRLLENIDDIFINTGNFGYEALSSLHFFEQGLFDFSDNDVKLLNMIDFNKKIKLKG